MDKIEAAKLLDKEVSELKQLPYAKFKEWLEDKDHPCCTEVIGESGQTYQIETSILLDSKANIVLFSNKKLSENITVVVSIDTGDLLDLNTYSPMTKVFTITPDNTLVSE